MKLKHFLHNRTALAGLTITTLFLLAVFFGPMLSKWSSNQHDFMNALQPPSWAHPFGTDSLGRDVITRVLEGARISLLISVSGVFAAMVFGITAGLYSGFHAAGWT